MPCFCIEKLIKHTMSFPTTQYTDPSQSNYEMNRLYKMSSESSQKVHNRKEKKTTIYGFQISSYQNKLFMFAHIPVKLHFFLKILA